MSTTMHTAAPEAVDQLPEDFTSAWATVLLDLWEKRSRADRDTGDLNDDVHPSHSIPVMEDIADDE